MKRYLILEDGSYYEGEAFGSDNFRIGEIVFNTSMTGYQETLSDLSYCGQIVVMTYPLIGNYGINRDDFESLNPAIFGFIVKEACKEPNNFRSVNNLDSFLKSKEIAGIEKIDTRAITKKIREIGTIKAIMSDSLKDKDNIIKKLKNSPYANNQVKTVSTQKAYPIPNGGKKVILIDYGAKLGIIRELSKRNCNLIVVPYNTSADEILNLNPDGIMLSNGPGNPKDIPESIETIKKLIGKLPIFGICLGHQIISLACGADTIKLKFGHRGGNHPVKDLETNKVAITSQNHSYAVKIESLSKTNLILTHISLNDKSCEGIKHKKYPVFSVQYHPESKPGPEDSKYLFDNFINLMNNNKRTKNA